MSSRSNQEFLADILEAIRRARLYVEGMTYEEFLIDMKTQDAVVRTLEIMGEATKRLPAELRIEHNLVPWKQMAGVRDKLIHDYFGINYEIIWKIITEELPEVARKVQQILAQPDG